MILKNTQYNEILDFILEGKTYREISEIMKISKNTPYEMIKRLKTRGTIYPKTTKTSIYDPVIRKISERIRYYLLIKKNTYNTRKKVKLNNKEIYTLILAEGFNISFTKFKEIIKREKNKLDESHLDIIHIPGEIVQFDWGHMTININGKNKRIYFAVFTLPYSNYKKVYIAKKQNGASFTKIYKTFINEIGGIPPILLIDNMKIAKIHTSSDKNDIKLTRFFKSLSNHYGFEVRFCTPYRPNQKGNVENGVKVIKNELMNSYINSFENLEELQTYVKTTIDKLNNKMHPRKNDTCYRLMKHERSQFLDIPKKEYIYYDEKIRKVNKNNMVSFNYSKYSVPEGHKGETVTLRYNKAILYILSKDNEVLAYYIISKKKKSRRYRVWHMINKLRTKSEGFINSQEYRSMPSWLKKLLLHTFNRNTSDFIAFLEILKTKPKDIVKKCLRRNQLDYENLTVDILLNAILTV